MRKKSYEELEAEELVFAHYCRGQEIREWSTVLCSNCRGSRDGSYNVLIPRKKFLEYQEIDKKVREFRAKNNQNKET